MSLAPTAAAGAAILIGAVSVYVLTGRLRALAAGSAFALVVGAWLVLAGAGVVGAGPFSDTFLVGTTWTLLGFLIFKAVANFAVPHPVERWLVGSTTLAMVVLVGMVVAQA